MLRALAETIESFALQPDRGPGQQNIHPHASQVRRVDIGRHSHYTEINRYSEARRLPYVNVQITRGASREQKAELVRDITNSLARILGKKPEHTHVVIQEIAEADWGFSGMLTDDWKKAQGQQPDGD